MAKHIHRYERRILGKKGYTVFACNLPDCNHYISEKLAEGKRTICNRCGDEMILDSRAMKLVKPHCVDCIRSKRRVVNEGLLRFIQASDSPITSSTEEKLDDLVASIKKT